MDFAALQARMGRGILRDDLKPYYGDFLNDALQDIQNRHSFPCMKTTTQVVIPYGTGEQTAVLPANFKELQPDTPVFFITETGNYIPGRLRFESGMITQMWNERQWAYWQQIDWVAPFEIFFERYGLIPPVGVTLASGNLIPVAAQYSPTGTYELAGLLPGYVYTLTLGANEVSVTNGTSTITASGTFIAQEDFITVNESSTALANNLTAITASVVSAIVPAAGVTAVVGMTVNGAQPFNIRVDYYGYLPRLVNSTDQSPLANAYPEMVIAKAKAIAFETINDEEAYGFNSGLYEKQLMTAIRQDAYASVAGRVCRM